LVQLCWGFPPARPKGAPVINFRSEGRRFPKGRCLIPASHFFEFTGSKPPKSKWKLVVSGEKAEPEGKEYLYQGIPMVAFERRFNLADYVQVRDARMADGLLVIDLVREVPEALRPRRIEIANSNEPLALEHKQAA
jgi:hypothetical protein